MASYSSLPPEIVLEITHWVDRIHEESDAQAQSSALDMMDGFRHQEPNANDNNDQQQQLQQPQPNIPAANNPPQDVLNAFQALFAAFVNGHPAPAPAPAQAPAPADPNSFGGLFAANNQNNQNNAPPPQAGGNPATATGLRQIARPPDNPFFGMFTFNQRAPPTPDPPPVPQQTPVPPPQTQEEDSDEEMPSLMPIEDENPAGSSRNASSTSQAGPSRAHLSDDEDGLPGPLPSTTPAPPDEDADWETVDEDNKTPPPMAVMPDYRVDPSTWSYPDGLPSDPMLPLALVSRSMLYAARKELYGRSITVHTPLQLFLLSRTLASPQVTSSSGEDNSGPINQLIKAIAFNVCTAESGIGSVSYGRGGMRYVCEVIESCPRLKSISLRSDTLRSVWPPLEKALKRCTELHTICMRSGSDTTYPMVVSTDRLYRVAQYWPDLKHVDVLGLKTSLVDPIPDFSHAFNSFALTSMDISDAELQALLIGSVGTLESLKLSEMTNRTTRSGLANVLLAHADTLRDLHIGVLDNWHPRPPNLPPSTSAETSAYLLHCVITKCKKLKTLSFCGPLASSAIFLIFPASLQKLSWGFCPAIEPSRVASHLAKPYKSGRPRLPKLKCVSVIQDDLAWGPQELGALKAQLKERQACFHGSRGLTMGGGIVNMDIAGGLHGLIPIAVQMG